MENYNNLNQNFNNRLNDWINKIKETNNKTVIYSLSDINYKSRFEEMIKTFNTSKACFAMCALDKETNTFFLSKNIPTVLLDKEEDNFNHLVCISKFLLTKVLLNNGFNVIMSEADIFWKIDVTDLFNDDDKELIVSQHTYDPEVNIGFYRVISNINTINFFNNLMDWIYDPKFNYTEDIYKNIYLKKKPHLAVDQKIFDYALRNVRDRLESIGHFFSNDSLNKLSSVKIGWGYLDTNILMHWPIHYPNNYKGVHIWSGYNKNPYMQIQYAHSNGWFLK